MAGGLGRCRRRCCCCCCCCHTSCAHMRLGCCSSRNRRRPNTPGGRAPISRACKSFSKARCPCWSSRCSCRAGIMPMGAINFGFALGSAKARFSCCSTSAGMSPTPRGHRDDAEALAPTALRPRDDARAAHTLRDRDRSPPCGRRAGSEEAAPELGPEDIRGLRATSRRAGQLPGIDALLLGLRCRQADQGGCRCLAMWCHVSAIFAMCMPCFHVFAMSLPCLCHVWSMLFAMWPDSRKARMCILEPSALPSAVWTVVAHEH